MTGDMGELFNDLREHRKEQRRENLKQAEESCQNWPGWTKHTPYHWSRDVSGHRLDWWPSARKWQYQKKIIVGTEQDLRNFIRKREPIIA